jgi:hypothetical protein
MDWRLNCKCHRKNILDPENGGAKNGAVAEKLKETDADQYCRISPAQQAAEFLGDSYIRRLIFL